MNERLFSESALKDAIDIALENYKVVVMDFTELTLAFREFGRWDHQNNLYNVETFAKECGFDMTFRDHQREILFSRSA